jgi:hypothetical protein
MKSSRQPTETVSSDPRMVVMVSLSWTVSSSLKFLLLLSMILYICPLL